MASFHARLSLQKDAGCETERNRRVMRGCNSPAARPPAFFQWQGAGVLQALSSLSLPFCELQVRPHPQLGARAPKPPLMPCGSSIPWSRFLYLLLSCRLQRATIPAGPAKYQHTSLS
eukprot:366344-Chlamydomonas_euryale.AAC.3